MAFFELSLRNLSDDVRQRLADRAMLHGRSVEEEAGEILKTAVADSADPTTVRPEGLGSRIARRFASIGMDREIATWQGPYPTPPDLHS